MKCADCEFWKRYKNWQNPELKKPWGECSAIVYPEKESNEDRATMSAAFSDDDVADYLEEISFETHEAFGCVLFKERQQQ